MIASVKVLQLRKKLSAAGKLKTLKKKKILLSMPSETVIIFFLILNFF